MSSWFFGVFPFCIPLMYSLGASCSFLIYILLFTDKKKNQAGGEFNNKWQPGK